MRRVAFSLMYAVLAAFPTYATGETITVRSGEHAGFSRLVLNFPDPTEWKVTDGARAVTIEFATARWQFLTGSVFDFIPRSRIRDIGQDERGSLVLTLGCDCEVEVFEVANGALVLDVKDSLAGLELNNVARISNEVIPETSPFVPDAVPSDFLALPGFKEPAATILPAPESSPYRNGKLGLPDPTAKPGDLPLVPQQPAVSFRKSSDALTRSLAEDIGRAASRGILKPAGNGQQGATEPPVQDPDQRLTSIPGVAVRMPDEKITSRASGGTATLGVTSCPRDASLDLAAWAPVGVSPAEAVAIARAQLIGDLDDPDPDAALDLVRLYLSLGFGAEALGVLQALIPRHDEARLLADIAVVLDGSSASRDLLTGLSACVGRAQLWFQLAHPQSAETDPEDILVALSELPLHLRRLLAPRLAAAFAGNGDDASAESARRLVSRAPGPHGAAMDLWEARGEAKNGVQGVAMLAELASGSSTVSAEALASLLELKIGQNDEPDISYLELAEARVHELRGSPIAARLSIALFRGDLIANDFAGAHDRLDDVVLPTGLQPKLLDEFLTRLISEAADATFLVLASSVAESRPSDIKPDTALDAARRMVELGFEGLARDLVRLAPDTNERRLLQSRIALQSGLIPDALTALADLESPEALTIRAEALAKSGRHLEAAEVFREAGALSRAQMSLWLSGQWERIADEGAGPRSEAAGLISIESPAAEAPKDLITKSEAVRAMLGNLLDATATP